MVEAIQEFFLNLFGGNALAAIFVLAMIPIVELRGSILFGKSLMESGHIIQDWQLFLVSYLGSMIVVPIILLCLIPLINWLKKTKFFSKMANRLEAKFKKKSSNIADENKTETSAKKKDIYKMLGIIIFVAIPLPGTGVWTGAAVAVFIGLGFKKSLLSVAIGDLIAGGIMMLIGALFSKYINWVLLGFFILVAIIFLYFIYEMFIKKDKSLGKTENNGSDK